MYKSGSVTASEPQNSLDSNQNNTSDTEKESDAMTDQEKNAEPSDNSEDKEAGVALSDNNSDVSNEESGVLLSFSSAGSNFAWSTFLLGGCIGLLLATVGFLILRQRNLKQLIELNNSSPTKAPPASGNQLTTT